MIQDFSASAPGEMTVSRGQQVEVVEAPASPASPDMVRVRIVPAAPTSGAAVASSSGAEGLVPYSCLKFPPRSQLNSNSRTELAEHGE